MASDRRQTDREEAAAGHDGLTDGAAPRRPLSRGQKAALGAAGFLVLAMAFTGPYLSVIQSHQANEQLKELRRSDAGIQQLLRFVAQVGPNAKGSQDGTRWYVQEFRAICDANPHCRQAPLPPALQQLVGGSTTTTTPTTSTTSPSS